MSSETAWQDIKTAPKDGTPVKAGTVGPMSIGGVPLYPVTSRFIDGKWQANFGSKENERWSSYDPQPTVWRPIDARQPPTGGEKP